MTTLSPEEAIRNGQGERLRAIRNRYHVSQTQFAKDLQIDRVALWYLETDKRAMNSHTVYMLWDKYKVPPAMSLGIEKLRF